jgi:hypothetical protein
VERKVKEEKVENVVKQPIEFLGSVPEEQPNVEQLEGEPGKSSVEKDPDLIKWDFGHLTFQCYKCGHLAIIQHDVEDGIQLILPTTNKHEWKLVCPRCKNSMRLYWQESPKKKEPSDEPKTESKTE